MKERAILFSSPMILAMGSKTQTRRLVKPQPTYTEGGRGFAPGWCADGRRKDQQLRSWKLKDFPGALLSAFGCPYGIVGDRLWVKETWRTTAAFDHYAPRDLPDTAPVQFAAERHPATQLGGKSRPSIFMRRHMSRLTLEVTGVRVEQLQSIGEEDAKAEGIRPLPLQDAAPGCWWTGNPAAGRPLHARSSVEAYRLLWEAITGAGRWAANPWVWVVEFRRLP